MHKAEVENYLFRLSQSWTEIRVLRVGAELPKSQMFQMNLECAENYAIQGTEGLVIFFHLMTVFSDGLALISCPINSATQCTNELFLCFAFQAAKLANYAKFQRLCDSLFVMFGFVFVSSRLGIYPFW